MVTQRFIKIPQTVLHPLLALHRLEMPFINKPGAKAETKLIVVSRRRDDCEDLPGTNIADADHMVSHLRPDDRVFGGLHIAHSLAVLAKQAGGGAE